MAVPIEQSPPGNAGAAGFWRIPPFPGARVSGFHRLASPAPQSVSLDACLAAARTLRVGGAFWAAQPDLPASYVLVRCEAALAAAQDIACGHGLVLWLAESSSREGAFVGECDPWHMLSGARALVCEEEDEARLVAALLNVPTFLVNGHRIEPDEAGESLLGAAFPVGASFANPFGGEPLDLAQLIALCGHWRCLIDSNRAIEAAVGFAFWKQESVRPLLWNGVANSPMFKAPSSKPAGAVAIWRSRTPAAVVGALKRMGAPLVEVEDGFLRSNGLGADCVAPLSITVDPLGAYFDPARPSQLENLLQNGDFDRLTLDRARRLRETVVAAGLGKYERGSRRLERFAADRRHILVTGQVEDDRSILAGGAGLTSNLDLLRRVRANAPDAFIVYKPHPDVLAGHRKGEVAERQCRKLADRIEPRAAIASLIDVVDEVHVNTSLAGFEGLLRGRKVTTYGVPFYAGWGLTTDLGPVPARRTRTRTLDELVAATLLLYPRYYDPESGLPCPAEVVVDRLTADRVPATGLLVAARRLQGRFRRTVQRLSQ